MYIRRVLLNKTSVFFYSGTYKPQKAKPRRNTWIWIVKGEGMGARVLEEGGKTGRGELTASIYIHTWMAEQQAQLFQ
jgi:hypothetical protein